MLSFRRELVESSVRLTNKRFTWRRYPSRVLTDQVRPTPPMTSPNAEGLLRKILVVDDEDYVRRILRGMIESMHLEVVEAVDGFAGLDLLRSGTDFAACVLDLTMPGMSGMDVLSCIQEEKPEMPVLLVSGYSRHEVRQEQAKSSLVSFLQKPFTVEEFRVAMEAQLAT